MGLSLAQWAAQVLSLQLVGQAMEDAKWSMAFNGTGRGLEARRSGQIAGGQRGQGPALPSPHQNPRVTSDVTASMGPKQEFQGSMDRSQRVHACGWGEGKKTQIENLLFNHVRRAGTDSRWASLGGQKGLSHKLLQIPEEPSLSTHQNPLGTSRARPGPSPPTHLGSREN